MSPNYPDDEMPPRPNTPPSRAIARQPVHGGGHAQQTGVAKPQFGTQARGYNRAEVDQLIGDYNTRLNQANNELMRLQTEKTSAETALANREAEHAKLDGEHRYMLENPDDRSYLEQSSVAVVRRAKMEANQILAEAREQASRIVSDATNQIAEGKRKLDQQRESDAQVWRRSTEQVNRQFQERETELESQRRNIQQNIEDQRAAATAEIRTFHDEARNRVVEDFERRNRAFQEHCTRELAKIAAQRSEVEEFSRREGERIDRVRRTIRSAYAGMNERFVAAERSLAEAKEQVNTSEAEEFPKIDIGALPEPEESPTLEGLGAVMPEAERVMPDFGHAENGEDGDIDPRIAQAMAAERARPLEGSPEMRREPDAEADSILEGLLDGEDQPQIVEGQVEEHLPGTTD